MILAGLYGCSEVRVRLFWRQNVVLVGCRGVVVRLLSEVRALRRGISLLVDGRNRRGAMGTGSRVITGIIGMGAGSVHRCVRTRGRRTEDENRRFVILETDGLRHVGGLGGDVPVIYGTVERYVNSGSVMLRRAPDKCSSSLRVRCVL